MSLRGFYPGRSRVFSIHVAVCCKAWIWKLGLVKIHQCLHALFDRVFVRQNLTCDKPIEVATIYSSERFALICTSCGCTSDAQEGSTRSIHYVDTVKARETSQSRRESESCLPSPLFFLLLHFKNFCGRIKEDVVYDRKWVWFQ